MFKHYIITRFNVKAQNWDKTKGGQRTNSIEWLEHRLFLFKKFCYPSLLNQSSLNFNWCIFLDSDTPNDVKKVMEDLSISFRSFHPIYIPSNENLMEAFRHFVAKTKSSNTEFILSTRLDNDDALHHNFVKQLQESLNFKAHSLYSFPYGIQLHVERPYAFMPYYQINNPFISYLEPISNFETVLKKNHLDWSPKEFKIIHIQCLHSNNLVNNPRGSLKAIPKGYLKRFSIQDLPPQSQFPLVFFNINNKVRNYINQLS